MLVGRQHLSASFAQGLRLNESTTEKTGGSKWDTVQYSHVLYYNISLISTVRWREIAHKQNWCLEVCSSLPPPLLVFDHAIVFLQNSTSIMLYNAVSTKFYIWQNSNCLQGYWQLNRTTLQVETDFGRLQPLVQHLLTLWLIHCLLYHLNCCPPRFHHRLLL